MFVLSYILTDGEPVDSTAALAHLKFVQHWQDYSSVTRPLTA